MPTASTTIKPSDVADWSDVAELQRCMAGSVERLAALASDVGAAKHVLEYDSDRRKRALARAMAAALLGGDSAAKAEAEGRASPGYDKEFAQLGKEHQAAEQIQTEWEVERLRWDTARSLLAMQRESTKHL